MPPDEPTPAADPRLTPKLEGVTDAESINDWDLPFELVETIRSQDEAYWDDHTTTPKAFLSLSLAKQLWSTRWGSISLMRIESEATRSDLAQQLLSEIDPADMGFEPLPIKEQGLMAASGSTPFDVLFLMFSMFLIAAALLLVALLAQMSVATRLSEIGLLGAIGWQPGAIRSMLVREHLVVAILGALFGTLLGIAYAALLIYLLQTVWIDAISTPFIELHVTARSLLLGLVGGSLVCWLTMRSAIAQAVRRPPRGLLLGAHDQESFSATKRQPGFIASIVLFAIAISLGAWGATLRGEAAAGAFFGSGAALVAVGLLLARTWLRGTTTNNARLTLNRLAWRGVSRNPTRSLLTMGLMSGACFMILATGAFRLPPTSDGVGGFSLVATTDRPVHYDLNSPAGRLELGMSPRDEALLDAATVYALRAEAGEDASCRNLYQATQPRVLGATPEFIERGSFAWAETLAGHEENPWTALAPRKDGVVPAVLDYNTAVYALKLYGGVGSRLTIRDHADREIEVEVVGLLKNSLLQGELIVSEADFLQLYPKASGYGYFLIDATQDQQLLLERLESRLSDYGFDAMPTTERLAGFLAVQNTYLSTFQALGALGLLLGAVGLSVAQFRSLAERRGELALMRAAGFSPNRIGQMVLAENLTLLVGGLLLGALSAMAALVPISEASGASPPWVDAALLIGLTLLIGLGAGRIASDRALSAPITPALRGD